jgi:hypothetical protein
MSRPTRRCPLIPLAVLMASGGAVRTASADMLTLSLSGTDGIFSATANFIFDDSGGSTTLGIQLINTGGTDEPGNQWLTGLFFDLAESPTMTYTGLGGTDADAFNDLVDTDLDPFLGGANIDAGDYWWLDQDASDAIQDRGGQDYALYAAGFFSFDGAALDDDLGAPSPQGRDGGIVNGATGIPGNGAPFVWSGAWFTFDLGDYDLAQAAVSNVYFKYGTSEDQPGFAAVVVPVPPAVLIGGLGLAAASILRRRVTG